MTKKLKVWAEGWAHELLPVAANSTPAQRQEAFALWISAAIDSGYDLVTACDVCHDEFSGDPEKDPTPGMNRELCETCREYIKNGPPKKKKASRK